MAVTSSRMALGSIFGAVTMLADTASNSLQALNDGVEMLNRTVSDASIRQRESSQIDLHVWRQQYKLDAARQIVEHEEDMEKWMTADPDRGNKVKSALEEIEKAIAPTKERETA